MHRHCHLVLRERAGIVAFLGLLEIFHHLPGKGGD